MTFQFIKRITNVDSFFEDLRFPASAINPPGKISDPDIDTEISGFLFDPGKTEIISITAQMSHTWREGTNIIPHVHWQKTTSAIGDVLWELKYRWAPIGEVMDSSWTIKTISTTILTTPDNDTANEHLISNWGVIDATGKEISDFFIMQLSRIGGDAADTYGDDVRLLELDVHFQVDGWGSELEGVKTAYGP